MAKLSSPWPCLLEAGPVPRGWCGADPGAVRVATKTRARCYYCEECQALLAAFFHVAMPTGPCAEPDLSLSSAERESVAWELI